LKVHSNAKTIPLFRPNFKSIEIVKYYYTVDCHLSREATLFIKLFFHCRVRVILFNATFNNISVKSWPSVLLVEEAGVPAENQ
jgi:hypothetical protein